MRDTQYPSSQRHDVGEPRILSASPPLASARTGEEQNAPPIKARDSLFRQAEQQIDEIKALRSELTDRT